MSLAALRTQITNIVAGGTPSQAPSLKTGLARLDAILPDGGIPHGRLTELLAPAGAGKTSIVRSLVATTLETGNGVAWIDATRTLDPRDWADLSHEVFWVVRPPEPKDAAWCADLLLRTGAFALVVLDGAAVLSRTVGVRLAHLARESDSALLLLGDGPRASDLGGSVRLRISQVSKRQNSLHSVRITLERGGAYRHTTLDISHDNRITYRLCTHPEVPDRRSVAKYRGSHGRGRRFAQPDYPSQRQT